MPLDPARRLEILRRACPAAYYSPNEGASEEFCVSHGGLPGSRSLGDRPWFESDAQARVAIGGNRAGKTTKLILEAGSAASGFRPWYPPSNPWHRRGLPDYEDRGVAGSFKKRIKIRYVVPNFGTHLPEVIAELEKWWPADWWKVTGRDDRGTPREIDWFTGAKILFLSHHMDVSDFEGIEADLNCWDEPPPRDWWIALERGVVSTGGRTIVGCTVLNASGWFWEEIVGPAETSEEVLITWHSIWDNTMENGGCETQTCKNVGLFLDKIPDPDERLAREHGHPMHIGGLVLSNWKESKLVDPFDLPSDCHIMGSIDPAGTKPFAGLHVAFFEVDGKIEGHVFDETWDPRMAKDLKLFADVWNAKERGETDPKHPMPSDIVLIDPFAEEIQKADRYGRSMRRILDEDYGIRTDLANRQGKCARLLRLNARIGAGEYKIWRNCRRIRLEMKRWTWKPDTPKLTVGSDDECDNLSYIDATDPFRMYSKMKDDVAPGVWLPDRYRDPQGRGPGSRAESRKNKRAYEKWKVMKEREVSY